MTAACIPTAYGRSAHAALASVVTAAKAVDSLAPVTVVVPHNSSLAVAARRELGRRGAMAAVDFFPPLRLAGKLAGRKLEQQGRRPVSTAVLAGLVRAVLQDSPGRFAAVQSHPATERSLLHAYRRLSELSPAARENIAAADPGAADVVRVHEAVRRGLRAQRLFGDPDLIDAAIDVLADDPDDPQAGPGTARVAGDQLGEVIVFLPQRLGPGHARLLRAVADRHGLTVIAGVTGVPAADQAVRRATEALGADWPADGARKAVMRQPAEDADPLPAASEGHGHAGQIADKALSVSDADDEVRHAVRSVIQAARDGIPLDRVALLYGSPEPYARLIAAALDTAGVPWVGRSVDSAADSLLGRSLLALLALGDHDFLRRDVCAWLGAAPVLGVDGKRCPSAAWERASRAAGVVAGVQQWQQRLATRVAECEAEAAELEGDEERSWLVERRRRESREAAGLREFVGSLAAALAQGDSCSRWAELSEWCQGLIETCFGGADSRPRRRWPPHEQAVAECVEKAVEALGGLDGIDPQPSKESFRRALRAQLEADPASHGKHGIGVYAGPLSRAVGFEFDRVVVLGMAEGAMPPRQREDPLLPDRVRDCAAGEMALAAHDVDDLHRALLAVMAAAGHVTFTFPRGDLRRNAERVPSRWLLDSAEARGEGRPGPSEIATASGDWFSEVPSFIAGMRRAGFAAHSHEYDVRAMLDLAESEGDRAGATVTRHLAGQPVPSLAGTPACAVIESRRQVSRGIELLHGRLSAGFTRFDGNLAAGDLRGVRLASPTDPDQIVSASRLEAWAKCPHAYFVQHVLGVRHTEDPEEQYRISALDRGSLLHQVIEEWMRPMTSAPAGFPADAAEFQDAVDHLLRLAEAGFERIELRGRAGRRLYWDRDQRIMKSDLTGFAEADRAMRSRLGSRPLALEWSFGASGGDEPPAEIDLGDGRTLRLRGAVDRIDKMADGGPHVIDYKTGKSKSYKPIEQAGQADPTLGGRFLQLGLYALASRGLSGPEATVRCDYWFVSGRERYRRIGYDFSGEVEAVVKAKTAGIAAGIADGVFPQHPKPGYRSWVDCHYCEPDGLGLAHQLADLRRMHADKAVGKYLELVGEDDG